VIPETRDTLHGYDASGERLGVYVVESFESAATIARRMVQDVPGVVMLELRDASGLTLWRRPAFIPPCLGFRVPEAVPV
jgi:hypothetical protein